MTVVKQLAAEGTTICATIHSPSSYTFNLFDKLLMLVKGRTVFYGNVGESNRPELWEMRPPHSTLWQYLMIAWGSHLALSENSASPSPCLDPGHV
jgi:ABC-type multidrug transport system ATPase subunit